MGSAIFPPSPVLRPSHRRVWLLRGVLAAVLAVLAWGMFLLTTSGRNGDAPQDGPSPAAAEDAAAARDRDLARAVLGQWHDTYMGTQRTTTLREDGSGEMVVQVVGSTTLRFEMVWSVVDGALRLRSLRGEPKLLAEAILRVQGDRAAHPILEAAPDCLRLLDRDGKTPLEWRRAP